MLLISKLMRNSARIVQIGAILLLSGCVSTSSNTVVSGTDKLPKMPTADSQSTPPEANTEISVYWRKGSAADLVERTEFVDLLVGRASLGPDAEEKDGFAIYLYLLIPNRTSDPSGKISSALRAYYCHITDVTDKSISRGEEYLKYSGVFYSPTTLKSNEIKDIENLQDDNKRVKKFIENYDYNRSDNFLRELSRYGKIQESFSGGSPKIYLLSYHQPLFRKEKYGNIPYLDKDSLFVRRIDGLSKTEIENAILRLRYFRSTLGNTKWTPDIGYPEILADIRTIVTNVGGAALSIASVVKALRIGTAAAESTNGSLVPEGCRGN